MTLVAAVSGGSSGIGLATSRLLARNGYFVYELSRSGKSSEGIRHLDVDVTDEASVRAAFAVIAEEQGKLDLLVNNAGMGISGTIEFCDPAQAKALFDVNYFGVLHCLAGAIPLLRKGMHPRIINISSVMGIYAFPFQAVYASSKGALNALTMALGNELRPFGIGVCALLLGDVKTGFTEARQKNMQGEELYGNTIQKVIGDAEKDERNGMSPERVAHRVLEVAGKNGVKPFYSLGVRFQFFLLLGRILPVRLINWVLWNLYL